tara:strand:+ start:14126 stop:16117 length:1992 start_codon:yes stop_codon:yes gene_type:complete
VKDEGMKYTQRFAPWLLLFFFTIAQFELLAQNNDDYSSCLDSAYKYNDKALLLYDNNPDSAIIYAKKALSFSKSCNFHIQEISAINLIAISNYIKCNFDVAEKYHLLALDKLEIYPDSAELANTYLGIANIYADKGALKSSLDYYLKAAEINQALSDSINLALIDFNMALIMIESGQFNAAKDKLFSSNAFIKNQDYDELKIDIYNSLSSIYTELNEPDSAHKYLIRSRVLLNDTSLLQSEVTKAYYLGYIGDYNIQFGSYEKGMAYLDSAIQITQQLSDEYSISLFQWYKAKGALKNGKLAIAEKWAKASLKNAVSSKLLLRQVPVLELLSKIYAQKGAYKDAWEYNTLVGNYKQKITDFDTEKQLLLYEMNLKREQEKQLIEENENYKQTTASQAESLELQNKYVIVISLSLAVMCIALFFIYRSYKERAEMVNTKDRIISILGHDLRSPIAQAQSIVSLSKSQAITHEEHDHLMNSVETSLGNISETLDNLLEWSKLVLNNSSFKPVVVPVDQVIRQGIQFNKKIVADKKIEINIEASSNILAFIDPTHLELILRNLINNAIKYSHINGRITIKASTLKNKVKIDITDEGIGMSGDEVQQILHKKNVISKRGTKNETGTGIGILLIHDFLERNNGEIEIISQMGKGSTFSIIIPKAQVSA